MARRVFFSFHYQNDIWRVSQVRNSWLTQPDRETAGFWDAAAWEKVKQGGDQAIKRWINNQLAGTSVTVVLIGAETSQRKYVKYEIQRSHELGKGLLGIYIHNLRDRLGQVGMRGQNPFDSFTIDRVPLSRYVRTYNWVSDNGRLNIGRWIQEAAQLARR